MSDAFIRVATKEINEELTSIDTILQSCKTDSDFYNKSEITEQHLHKIRGLAPMMGKIKVGEIAEMNDVLVLCIAKGKMVSGIVDVLKESTVFMKNDMNNNCTGFDELKQKIQTNYSKFLE